MIEIIDTKIRSIHQLFFQFRSILVGDDQLFVLIIIIDRKDRATFGIDHLMIKSLVVCGDLGGHGGAGGRNE